jgi:hypothetical protein
MGFFEGIDNENIGTFEMGGCDLEPIPNNTIVLAAPDEAKWDEYGGDRYISIRWVVMQPAEYKNRKVFQKVRVEDDDPKKAEKAKRMLAAIDANAGGKLMASGEEPTDQSLQSALLNKPMILKVMVWEIAAEQSNDGQGRSGNWVAAVSPRREVSAPAQTAGGSESSGMDDVPF